MKKFFKVTGIFLLAFSIFYVGSMIANIICNISLRNYIKSFAPVEYSEDRLVPTRDKGYITFVSDEDVNIMHITDIHIGGGFWTYKCDKKTIYELITMLQAEKPDLAILGGDNTYCVPKIGFNGGFTANNSMVARTVIEIFEHEKVYFSTVFGNHDTESFDYADRDKIGKLYADEKYKYCFFEQNFTDKDADTVPSVSNQIVLLENGSGKINKVLALLDTNAYTDTSFIASVMGKYDTIHPAQVEWVSDAVRELSLEEGLPEGEYLKTFFFFHIPIGEYRVALDELITENVDGEGNIISYIPNDDTGDTEFLEGTWGESIVCYGGLHNDGQPEDQDTLFEVLSGEMGSMEACFCGHDHCNDSVVYYKGVMLSYGSSLDNIAYGGDIKNMGSQRGATSIIVKPDGSFTQTHKNAYTDYGCRTDMFYDVDPDGQLYPENVRTIE